MSDSALEALRRELDELEKEFAARRPPSGDVEARIKWVSSHAAALAALARAREDLDYAERLTVDKAPRTVTSNQAMMTAEHKVALSKSRKGRDPKFLKYIRAKGFSQNTLAAMVGMSPSALSQSRRKPSDAMFRRIPSDKAEAIERLTGWPSADWP